MIGVEKKVEKMFGDKEKITAAVAKEDDLSQERATGSAEEEGEEGREPVRVRAPPQVSRDEREVHELMSGLGAETCHTAPWNQCTDQQEYQR